MQFAEELTPEAVEIDGYGHASALRLKKPSGETVILPAKSDPGGRGNAAEYGAGARGAGQAASSTGVITKPSTKTAIP